MYLPGRLYVLFILPCYISRAFFSLVFAEWMGRRKKDLCPESELALIQWPTTIHGGGRRLPKHILSARIVRCL